jgi:putative hydrolase of the HAD superfamily
MIKAVIFDLDDTLYDEIEYCRSGFACVSEFLSKQPDSPSPELIFDCLWEQFTAGNHTRTFNAALEQLGMACNDRLIGELVKTYRSHTPNITLPQDSKDILGRLCSKYTLAILTDGFLPAQKLKVNALGIEKYFKCIIYTEELGRDCWKPSPAGFEKLMETLNIEPQIAVYVADNEKKDFIAPKKLGILTIQLIRPARIHTESNTNPSAAAQYIIRKISELPQLLEQL